MVEPTKTEAVLLTPRRDLLPEAQYWYNDHLSGSLLETIGDLSRLFAQYPTSQCMGKWLRRMQWKQKIKPRKNIEGSKETLHHGIKRSIAACIKSNSIRPWLKVIRNKAIEMDETLVGGKQPPMDDFDEKRDALRSSIQRIKAEIISAEKKLAEEMAHCDKLQAAQAADDERIKQLDEERKRVKECRNKRKRQLDDCQKRIDTLKLVHMENFSTISEALIVRRDAPAAEKNASQTIDEALQSFKSGIDDLVKNVQSNELFQNLTHTLKQFTDTVQQQGEELVKKFKDQKPAN
ncbi:unnamed protein product [Callosobruchus maculatus]|uniref:Uncharacterized protein n=1 Tax=Callosobruchus maculatus TaxID=64391 RepID=A0A653CWN7_CALMS|nr:unnamed protein product [Callosobruchus maculatus]